MSSFGTRGDYRMPWKVSLCFNICNGTMRDSSQVQGHFGCRMMRQSMQTECGIAVNNLTHSTV